MVRISRFAFDNPRGCHQPPLVHPLDDFEYPGTDEPDTIALDPPLESVDDEQDELALGGPKSRPHGPRPRPQHRAA